MLLYAAAISLGVEMQATGAAEWLAQTVIAMLRPFGAATGTGLEIAVALLTTGVSNTMTAGAAVAVLGPVVLKTAHVAGQDPIVIGFITAISSAFGYLTPAAQPAFTIIYASGYLRGSDFLKIGHRMMIVSLLLLFAVAQLYWPFIHYLEGGMLNPFRRTTLSARQERAVQRDAAAIAPAAPATLPHPGLHRRQRGVVHHGAVRRPAGADQ